MDAQIDFSVPVTARSLERYNTNLKRVVQILKSKTVQLIAVQNRNTLKMPIRTERFSFLQRISNLRSNFIDR